MDMYDTSHRDQVLMMITNYDSTDFYFFTI